MNAEHRPGQGVVDQKDALSLYFEALLSEPMDEPQETRHVTEPEAPALPVVAPAVIGVPAIPDVALDTGVDVQITTVVDSDVCTELEAAEPLPEGVLDWAATPFQALLFKVSGLTLAVPLAELSGVQEWQDQAVTPMLGRIEWYLGLMKYRDGQVPVVDTAQLVLPADRLDQLIADDTERLGHVVFVQHGQWGLACDSVGEVIDLSMEQVKWRSSRSKRRWLAGTVLEHMCAIIDPPAFAEMLKTGIADELPADADGMPIEAEQKD